MVNPNAALMMEFVVSKLEIFVNIKHQIILVSMPIVHIAVIRLVMVLSVEHMDIVLLVLSYSYHFGS